MKKIKTILKGLLGIFFIAAGVNHFANPGFYAPMIPPYLPWPLLLVYLSGVFEIVLGSMVLIPQTTRLAAWGLIALLIAVFPANIHMAIHPELFPKFSPVMLWVRLPFQAVFIAWAYWYISVDKVKKQN